MGGKLAEGLREFVEQKIKTEREEFEESKKLIEDLLKNCKARCK